jgi:dihydrofolate reductase
MNTNTKNPPLVIVVALAIGSHAIGKDNQLLWHIPDDLKRFKALTLGHPIIFGKNTFESILATLGTPLPGRTNIVLTREPHYDSKGALIAHSLEEAIAMAHVENPTEIHIGGGAELYRQTLPLVSTIYATWVHSAVAGDTFFPEFENDFRIKTTHPPRSHNGLSYQWVDYERI